jgi:xanthine dehydrogenase YagR molybdenum-binding subunit
MTTAAPQPQAHMGQPAPRIDGRLKVTGAARYTADAPVGNPAFAFLVLSPIAKGRIVAMDVSAARAVPGVLDVLTHENAADAVQEAKFFGFGGTAGTTIKPLSSPQVWHDGQIIAVVVADTFEAAREAAYKVKVQCEEETPSAGFDSPGTQTALARDVSPRHSEDPAVGDAERAFEQAEVKVDVQYETPTQHHNPIELFATTCAWADGKLTVYEPSQFVYGLKNGIAEQLGIAPRDVEAKSPFVGGAFGSKGSITPRTALVAVAAKRINRPVKLVATRDQGFTIATYRAETRHHIRLGAARDGKLAALVHEGWEVTSRPDPYVVGGTKSSTRIYAAPNVASQVSLVFADRNTPGFMRSPPEVPYIFALETAMDELAVALGMDPVELRRVNDTMREPIKGLPYTSRSLMQCYDRAAGAFGWSQRSPAPGSMRDGDWLIGWGTASAVYPSQMSAAAARVRLARNGTVRVQIAAQEIGNGTYTVVGQMAAERLGVPLDAVTVELGDSELPPGPIAGGSITTASACNAVAAACERIRDKLLQSAARANDSPLAGYDPSTLTLAAHSVVHVGSKSGEPIDKIFDRLGVGTIEEYAEWLPRGAPPDALKALHQGQTKIVGGPMEDRIAYAFGAEFVEVRVHALTREIRVPRIVGAFAGGHIMNPRTARSQYLGGMIWGIGSALHEATEMDERRARYINDNLADYLVPVNADVDQVEVILVDEADSEVNPLGIKGIGELANVGTAAAISNAVYHATGKRIRKLPIRVKHLLDVTL